MRIDRFDTEKDILIVAEVGNNHEGSYTLAEDLVGLAAEAGANAVKFQTFKTEHYVSRRDEERYQRLKSFELSYDEFEKLSKLAAKSGLIFISTPFELESARFLDKIVSAFKIASSDNTFYPLLECVARTHKPILLSAGLADLTQLGYSKSLIEKTWHEENIQQSLAILHCVSSYPVVPEETNLLAIKTIQDEFHCTVGYSDHTLGLEAAVLAVALGARIIEKHFTINKHYSDFRDHQLAADPRELAVLVEKVKQARELLGTGLKMPQKSEKSIESLVRRTIVAKRDLAAGTAISADDITWVRPAMGLPPGKETRVLGKVLRKPVHMGDPILPEFFDA
ncbi:MAG: N-acetylneuraminate synthase family protein [bacterium]